jgi:DNA-binding SARP family transcriptional activator
MLKLNLLGRSELITEDDLPLRFRSQTEKALLIYLAHGGLTHGRAPLADLLWDARTTRQSLTNLRTVLCRLRKTTGALLITTRKTVAYAPDARQHVDSVRLLEQLDLLHTIRNRRDALQLRTVLHHYNGVFLVGFYVRAAPRFNEWVTLEREHIMQRLLAGYARLLAYALAQDDLDLTISTATAWLLREPLNEATHRHLLAALAENGQGNLAIVQHQRYAQRLLDELDVMPQRVTLALDAAIQRGEFADRVPQTASYQVNFRTIDTNR